MPHAGPTHAATERTAEIIRSAMSRMKTRTWIWKPLLRYFTTTSRQAAVQAEAALAGNDWCGEEEVLPWRFGTLKDAEMLWDRSVADEIAQSKDQAGARKSGKSKSSKAAKAKRKRKAAKSPSKSRSSAVLATTAAAAAATATAKTVAPSPRRRGGVLPKKPIRVRNKAAGSRPSTSETEDAAWDIKSDDEVDDGEEEEMVEEEAGSEVSSPWESPTDDPISSAVNTAVWLKEQRAKGGEVELFQTSEDATGDRQFLFVAVEDERQLVPEPWNTMSLDTRHEATPMSMEEAPPALQGQQPKPSRGRRKPPASRLIGSSTVDAAAVPPATRGDIAGAEGAALPQGSATAEGSDRSPAPSNAVAAGGVVAAAGGVVAAAASPQPSSQPSKGSGDDGGPSERRLRARRSRRSSSPQSIEPISPPKPEPRRSLGDTKYFVNDAVDRVLEVYLTPEQLPSLEEPAWVCAFVEEYEARKRVHTLRVLQADEPQVHVRLSSDIVKEDVGHTVPSQPPRSALRVKRSGGSDLPSSSRGRSDRRGEEAATPPASPNSATSPEPYRLGIPLRLRSISASRKDPPMYEVISGYDFETSPEPAAAATPAAAAAAAPSALPSAASKAGRQQSHTFIQPSHKTVQHTKAARGKSRSGVPKSEAKHPEPSNRMNARQASEPSVDGHEHDHADGSTTPTSPTRRSFRARSRQQQQQEQHHVTAGGGGGGAAAEGRRTAARSHHKGKRSTPATADTETTDADTDTDAAEGGMAKGQRPYEHQGRRQSSAAAPSKRQRIEAATAQEANSDSSSEDSDAGGERSGSAPSSQGFETPPPRQAALHAVAAIRNMQQPSSVPASTQSSAASAAAAGKGSAVNKGKSKSRPRKQAGKAAEPPSEANMFHVEKILAKRRRRVSIDSLAFIR